MTREEKGILMPIFFRSLVVNNLRLKVMDWCKKQWPGVTETTGKLFRWWFEYPEKQF